MNSFCQCLRLALLEKFNIDVNVFVSKKKKLLHLSLEKPLISYQSVKEIVSFVRNYWRQQKYFYPDYFYIRPRLNQSLKWRYDYIFLVKNKAYNKRLTTY